jgi:hypothetical protein
MERNKIKNFYAHEIEANRLEQDRHNDGEAEGYLCSLHQG